MLTISEQNWYAISMNGLVLENNEPFHISYYPCIWYQEIGFLLQINKPFYIRCMFHKDAKPLSSLEDRRHTALCILEIIRKMIHQQPGYSIKSSSSYGKQPLYYLPKHVHKVTFKFIR